jgi:hypothetical protein
LNSLEHESPPADPVSFRLLVGNVDRGAAYRLTSFLVVTAWHCIKPLAKGDAVTLVWDHFEAAATVREVNEEFDLAVLDLVEIIEMDLAVFSVPDIDAPWWAPSRPSSIAPALSGKVTAVGVTYTLATGADVELLQLLCDQELESFKGYSGNPVLGRNAHIYGILVEQFLRNPRGKAASNVLFALDSRLLRRALRSLEVPVMVGEICRHDESFPLPAEAEADSELVARLERCRRLLDSGLISEDVWSDLQRRALGIG